MKTYLLPNYVEWLLRGIQNEIGRVYWNINQKSWNGGGFFQDYEYDNDPCGIEGVHWKNHRNEDETEINVSFDGVKIYWYKYLGRGMEANVKKSNDEWIDWFDRFIRKIKDHECEFNNSRDKHGCLCMSCIEKRRKIK